MHRRLIVAAAVFALAAPAAAQDAAPTVAQFLTDYAAFKAETDKPEAAAKATRLMQTVAAAATRYKAGLAADAAAHRTPRACPAKGSSDTFEMDVLATAMAEVPASARGEPFDQAFFAFLDKRHPCPTT
jgi:hypothetical protein